MRRQRGLSLIECLVSVVVFAIGIFGAAQCLMAAYGTIRLSEQTMLANMYVQEEIEEIIAFGYAPLDSAPTTKAYADPHFPSGKLVINFSPAPQAVTGYPSLVEWTLDASWLGATGSRTTW